jgi:hypothetical protein
MAFNIADLILSSCCCLSESFLKYLRCIFLILNLAMLAYPFVALRSKHINHTYCVGIELSSWSSLFASLYFALSLSFHIKYRTLMKRHSEYHESLLELSSDRGIERTEPLSRWEKISVLTCLSAFVCAITFVCSHVMATGPSLSTSVKNYVPLQAALVTASTVTLEFLFNRFTLSFFALFEVVVLAIVFSLCTWLVNWTDDCTLFLDSSQHLGNRTNATWYDLHLFENVEGKYMPYFFFLGVLVLSTAILFMFTALRFTCLAKDKDRSEHTNKIMMCAL